MARLPPWRCPNELEKMSQPNTALMEAHAAFRAGQLQQARQLALELLSSQPNDVGALHLLGMIAYGMGDLEQQATYLHRLLSVAPNHAPSLNALANMLRSQGKLAEAVQAALGAVHAEPRYVPAYNTLGLCYEQLEKYDEAVNSFKEAIRLKPEVPQIHVNLGAALEHLGLASEALGAYRQALELAPHLPEALDGMGRVLSAQKRRAEAGDCFVRALTVTPNSVPRLLRVADAKAVEGKIGESLALAERALTIEPESASALCFYGQRMQDLGRFDEARAAFRKSIEVNPEQGAAYLGLVSAGKIPNGDPILGEMQELAKSKSMDRSESVLLHTALSKGLDDAGEYERAIWHVDEANRLELEAWKGRKPFDQQAFARYVDGIINRFTQEYFQARKSWDLDSELPLLIIGLPRSGTTLTEQILSSHPRVSPAGELTFWTDADVTDSIVSLAENPARSRELGNEYERLLRTLGPGARFVTDKRPDNFLFAGLIHVLFQKAPFIHCRRDLIDNALSLYMTPYRTRPPFVHSREDIVFYVRQYQRLMEHWHAILPTERILDLDYEATVRDPGVATRTLLDFCGLEWDENCLRPEENRRAVSTPSNWQSRQAVYSTSVERWQHYEPWLGALLALGERNN